MHPIIRDIKEVLLSTGFEHTYILSVSTSPDLIELILHLPYHTDQDEFEDVLNNLKEELNATDVKITKRAGKKVTILFGKRSLTNIEFREELLIMNSLKIQLPSAFGSCILDFEDGASCHLLNGGTTRMGKTTFLLYLCTVLYLQTNGQIQLYITSTKAKDYYPFDGIAHINMEASEFNQSLDTIIEEYKHRNSLLYSKELAKATDSKSVKKLYPHMYKFFQPVFVIIDEYSRFSDNKEIQSKVQELVETAGYVNMHVIISTTRPDARTVLPARIKGNLLARICFTTADKNNSIVILDQEGAEKLGKIQGRAIYLDSETNIIQIPYLNTERCNDLLTPYKKEIKQNEQENQRQNDNNLTNKIQNMFKESDSPFDIQSEYKSNQHNKQSNETSMSGWFLLESTKRKG